LWLIELLRILLRFPVILFNQFELLKLLNCDIPILRSRRFYILILNIWYSLWLIVLVIIEIDFRDGFTLALSITVMLFVACIIRDGDSLIFFFLLFFHFSYRLYWGRVG